MLPAIPVFSLAASPEQRAIEHLSREVPKWSRENHCFSYFDEFTIVKQ